ncbi:hypothetical protein [Riemerella anatipestifer]|uniref:hypothetical protein n=1 Tax=Riemerella anatipestifer TaxID=34085 RepID=UPI0021F91429|nr:hypothetical protein [Riemerella anatipestifer]MCW0491008.1 hypothetical protein [Riemerella anatipestifer]
MNTIVNIVRKSNESIDTIAQRVVNYTNERLAKWYKVVKEDYNIEGKGKAVYNPKNQSIVITYTENGITKEFEMIHFVGEVIDYVFDVWSAQG